MVNKYLNVILDFK